jgi:uncharacterized membrane protein
MKSDQAILIRYRWLFLGLIVLGIGFRIFDLGDRVFWVDEVATAMRIAGYTKSELMVQLRDTPALTPIDLKNYIHLTLDTSWSQTWQALIQHPEHAPLYFLLLRCWAQLWGSSIVALRSLSVLFSVMAIPLMGRLAYQLFRSHLTAWLTMVLVALSPFLVAYGQEARAYSLWTVTILLSWSLLLQALETSQYRYWSLYSLSITLGLYTQILSVLVILAQGLYVSSYILNCAWSQETGCRSRTSCRWTIGLPYLRGFGGAIVLASLSFIPWLLVLGQQWYNFRANTAGIREPLDLLSSVAMMVYGAVVLLFDFPIQHIGFDVVTLVKVLGLLAVFSLMGLALVTLVRHTSPLVWRGVCLITFFLPLGLITIDLVTQSRYSATPRYLITFHLGMILAIAFYLAHLFKLRWKRFGAALPPQLLGESKMQGGYRLTPWAVFWGVVLLCFLSYGLQLRQAPKYQKNRNLHNRAIARVINPMPSPLILSEPRHVQDLISLSLDLKSDVQIQFSTDIAQSLAFARSEQQSENATILLFHPSQMLLDPLQMEYQSNLYKAYDPPLLVPHDDALSLWQLED